jgi:hypothetical protein
MEKYYSIRVVEASSPDDALNKVVEGGFDEEDEFCDRIMNIKDLFSMVMQRYNEREV